MRTCRAGTPSSPRTGGLARARSGRAAARSSTTPVTDARAETRRSDSVSATSNFDRNRRVECLTSGHYDFRQVNALPRWSSRPWLRQVLDEVLAIVLDSTLELTGAERGFIPLAELAVNWSSGPRARRGGITLNLSTKPASAFPDEVFSTGLTASSTNARRCESQVHGVTLQLGIRHVMHVPPLKVAQFAWSPGDAGERRIGVLYLDSREKGYMQAAGVLNVLAGCRRGD